MASSNLDPQSTLTEELNLITTRAQTFTGANGAAIALGESDVTEIVCRASSGAIAPPVGAHLRVEGSFTGICLQTGQALRCDDTESDNRVDPAVSRAVGIRSMVVVPVKDKETILGVLGVFSGKAHAFSDLHFAVLKTMASEITAAIQKAKRVAEGGTAPTPALGTPAPKFAGPMTGKFTIPIPQKQAAAPASASTAVKTPPPIPTPMPTPVPTPVRTAPPPPPPPPPKLVPVTTPVKTAPPPPPPPPPLPPKEHVTASAAAAAPAPAKRDSGGYMIPPIKPSDRPKEQEISFGTLDRVGEKGKKPFPIMPVGIAVGVVVVVVVGYFVFSGGSKSTPEPAATTTASKPAPSTPAPTSPTATGTSTSPTTTTSTPPAATTTAPTTTASAPPPAKTTTAPPPPPPAPTKTQTAKAPPVKTGPAPVTRGTGQTSNNSNENVAAPTISLAPTNTPTIPMGNVNVPTAALRTSQVAPAQLLSRVDPQYPSVARQFHAEGNVVVNATVGADGKVKTATAVSGNPLLRDSAVTAVRQWRYKPAMLNGQAVESTVQVTLKFSAQ